MDFPDFLTAELPELSRYARVLAGSRDAAHDLVAQTLVKAQENWPRIAHTDSPAAYVHRMVTNAFVSEKRRWSTRNIRLTTTGVIPDRTGVDFSEAVDRRDLLEKMLRKLPRHQLCAIVLRFYLGADDSDIARELGCSEGAVRTYVSRGLRSLRLRLDDDQPFDRAAPPELFGGKTEQT